MSHIRARVLPAVALTAATMVIPAVAFAASGGSVAVTPSPAQDGQRVMVTVTGCGPGTKSATAASKAFAQSKPVKLTPAKAPAKPGTWSATVMIGSHVKPGRYAVQGVCMVDMKHTTASRTNLIVKANKPAQPAKPASPAKPGQPGH